MNFFLLHWLGIKKHDPSIYPQQAGEDWYWIGLGVSDVTQKRWNSSEIDYSTDEKERLRNVRRYKGKLRSDPENWPDPWREEWFKGHRPNPSKGKGKNP